MDATERRASTVRFYPLFAEAVDRALFDGPCALYWAIRKACRDERIVEEILVRMLRAKGGGARKRRINLRPLNKALAAVVQRALWDGGCDLYRTIRRLRSERIAQEIVARILREAQEETSQSLPMGPRFRRPPQSIVSRDAAADKGEASAGADVGIEFDGEIYVAAE